MYIPETCLRESNRKQQFSNKLMCIVTRTELLLGKFVKESKKKGAWRLHNQPKQMQHSTLKLKYNSKTFNFKILWWSKINSKTYQIYLKEKKSSLFSHPVKFNPYPCMQVTAFVSVYLGDDYYSLSTRRNIPAGWYGV